MKTELLDFIKEQGWVLNWEGEVYSTIGHFCLRVSLTDGKGQEIALLIPGWIGGLQGYSYGDFDAALEVLAMRMSNSDLGLYKPIAITDNGKGFDTTVLVTAPELVHTKKLDEWLDSAAG